MGWEIEPPASVDLASRPHHGPGLEAQTVIQIGRVMSVRGACIRPTTRRPGDLLGVVKTTLPVCRAISKASPKAPTVSLLSVIGRTGDGMNSTGGARGVICDLRNDRSRVRYVPRSRRPMAEERSAA